LIPICFMVWGRVPVQVDWPTLQALEDAERTVRLERAAEERARDRYIRQRASKGGDHFINRREASWYLGISLAEIKEAIALRRLTPIDANTPPPHLSVKAPDAYSRVWLKRPPTSPLPHWVAKTQPALVA
jgi:hypothetical protein